MTERLEDLEHDGSRWKELLGRTLVMTLTCKFSEGVDGEVKTEYSSAVSDVLPHDGKEVEIPCSAVVELLCSVLKVNYDVENREGIIQTPEEYADEIRDWLVELIKNEPASSRILMS